MSVNSEKFEIKETQEIPATNGPQRIIALKHFNALYKKLKADGETLGRKDFTIHVDSKFEKYSNKFTYSDVNHKEGETGPQTRIMRISKSQETREGIRFRILQDGKFIFKTIEFNNYFYLRHNSYKADS